MGRGQRDSWPPSPEVWRLFISRRKAGEDLPTQVSDATAQLLELMVFAMFGAFAVIDGWKRADWRVVAFAVIAVSASGWPPC